MLPGLMVLALVSSGIGFSPFCIGRN